MNRLKELRLKKGLNMKEAAEHLGIPYTTYVSYEKGDREPNSERLIELADFFRCSIDYLIGWSGDPLDYENDPDVVADIPLELLDHFRGDVRAAYRVQRAIEKDVLAEGLLGKSDIMEMQDPPSNAIPYTPQQMVPVLGEIAAGIPMFADENMEGYETADVQDPSGYFYLRVKGDSMIGANIVDGALVLIRKQPCADEGQIVACLVNGDSATLKRFRRHGSTIFLMPENHDYPPIILDAKDFESGNAHILGVAVEMKIKF